VFTPAYEKRAKGSGSCCQGCNLRAAKGLFCLSFSSSRHCSYCIIRCQHARLLFIMQSNVHLGNKTLLQLTLYEYIYGEHITRLENKGRGAFVAPKLCSLRRILCLSTARRVFLCIQADIQLSLGVCDVK
jgi:hypothetical protein